MSTRYEKDIFLVVALIIWLFLGFLARTYGVFDISHNLNRSKSLSRSLVRENEGFLVQKGSFLVGNNVSHYKSQVLASNTNQEPTNRELIEKYFDESVWDYAEAVMYCESSGDPEEVNWEYHKAGNCYGSFGYFQISCNNFTGNYKKMFDPETNIKKAAELYERRGFQPWPNCP